MPNVDSVGPVTELDVDTIPAWVYSLGMKRLVLILMLVSSVLTGFALSDCQEDQMCWDCHSMGNKVCGSDL